MPDSPSPELSRTGIKGYGMTRFVSIQGWVDPSVSLGLHNLTSGGAWESPPSGPEAYLLIVRLIPPCEPGGNKGGAIPSYPYP